MTWSRLSSTLAAIRVSYLSRREVQQRLTDTMAASRTLQQEKAALQERLQSQIEEYARLQEQLTQTEAELRIANAQNEVQQLQLGLLAKWQEREQARVDAETARYSAAKVRALSGDTRISEEEPLL